MPVADARRYLWNNLARRFAWFAKTSPAESCCSAERQFIQTCPAADDVTWHEPRNAHEAFIALDGALQIDLPDGTVMLGIVGTYAGPKLLAQKPFPGLEVRLLLNALRTIPNAGGTGGDRIA